MKPFHPETPQTWREGWRKVQQLGPAAGPALVAAWEKESNLKRRHVLLCAQSLTDAPPIGDWLFAGTTRVPTNDEKFLGLLTVALGRPRDGNGANVLGATSANDPVSVQVAAGLALSRHRSRGPVPETWLRHDDAGLQAVAVLCHAAPATWSPPRASGRFENARALVLRAWLLGDVGRLDDARRIAAALEALNDTSTSWHPVRAAAAQFLGGHADPGAATARIDTLAPELVTAFAFHPTGRQIAYAREWLGPAPSPRLPESERARQVVLFCLAAPAEALEAGAASLAADRTLCGAAALALTWRRLHGGSVPAVVVDAFRSVPEGIGLRLGAIETGDVPQITVTDPQLDAAFRAAVEGRADDAAIARAVEQVLWRRGQHPGATILELRHALVRDLLLAGSDLGRAKFGLGREVYLPQRQDPNALVFQVALEFYVHVEGTHASTSGHDLRR